MEFSSNEKILYQNFKKYFEMPEDIFNFFKEYFVENIEAIQNISKTENIYLYNIFFKEINSEDYIEIFSDGDIFQKKKTLDLLRNAMKEKNKDRYPILWFYYKWIDTPRSVHMTLLKDWNNFKKNHFDSTKDIWNDFKKENLYKNFKEFFEMPEDIFNFFKEYFVENIEAIQNISKTENIYLKSIYFKEILSWEYPKIYFEDWVLKWENLKILRYSINDSKSELTPVFEFCYKNIESPRSVHLELHKDWNPF